LVLVAPADSVDKLVAESLRKYIVPPPWQLLTDEEYDKLADLGPRLKYWALRHNGRVSLGKDNPKALKHYEEAMKTREDVDIIFYRHLIGACLKANDIDKAHKYAKKAMGMEPKSLSVMKFYIDITRDTAIKNKELNAAVARSLFSVCAEMEKVNPDYASTYLLGGDLFFRGSMLQNALNSFQIYLEKYQTIDAAWQQKNQGYHEHAARAIELCHQGMSRQVK